MSSPRRYEHHANLSYMLLTSCMDLIFLHVILLRRLQLLLLQPASEVRSAVSLHLLVPPLQPPRDVCVAGMNTYAPYSCSDVIVSHCSHHRPYRLLRQPSAFVVLSRVAHMPGSFPAPFVRLIRKASSCNLVSNLG